ASQGGRVSPADPDSPARAASQGGRVSPADPDSPAGAANQEDPGSPAAAANQEDPGSPAAAANQEARVRQEHNPARAISLAVAAARPCGESRAAASARVRSTGRAEGTSSPPLRATRPSSRRSTASA